ncbi:hypothetical protein PFISCL1PPCAC_16997 [Pristionchus fissidentatus]|uniref:Uncharacterized protein n=1 Tax=Pristionchus fissidentatus TaxID=1538716 RepID=A0AAV5W1K1_9BILA|nr:hypothetical protein PFISCL1PPCAC_16997 [Pristionchus fissidentatus]
MLYVRAQGEEGPTTSSHATPDELTIRAIGDGEHRQVLANRDPAASMLTSTGHAASLVLDVVGDAGRVGEEDFFEGHHVVGHSNFGPLLSFIKIIFFFSHRRPS